MTALIFYGGFLSSLIGLFGFYKKALTLSGALGAMFVGTTIFVFGGYAWGGVLIFFFASSSGLSFFKSEEKAHLAEKFDKGPRRDLAQTLANGGAAAIVAVMTFLFPSENWWLAFVGIIAAVNADTWATELGVLAKTPPRLITTGLPVLQGTSGGVTRKGTLAALTGAAFIALTAITLQAIFPGSAGATIPPLWLVVGGTVGGLGGALFDSVLGATVQAIYYCDVCQKETEQKYHRRCGHTPTRMIRGWAWLNNDWVNFISSVVGGVMTWLIILGVVR